MRQHGFDALSSQEAQLLSADDNEQFAFAVAAQRAIVTFNFHDFINRHEQYLMAGREHWGIVLSTAEPFGILLRRLLRLMNAILADELKNQIRWLNNFR
jgi:hypothetical protein